MTTAVPSVGTLAPSFTLPSTSGKDFILSSHRGRSNVLLAFFPLAFTGVCTAELCDLTEDLSRFTDADTLVLGISVDSIPALQEFKRKNGITVDLLSDFRREVSRAYGTLIDATFFSKRAYFIVDREGILRWSYVEAELGNKRTNDELLDRLSTLSVG